jgi:hypothetical protein
MAAWAQGLSAATAVPRQVGAVGVPCRSERIGPTGHIWPTQNRAITYGKVHHRCQASTSFPYIAHSAESVCISNTAPLQQPDSGCVDW